MVPNWLKRSLVVLISILTFGMVTPQDLLADQPKNDSQSSKSFSSIQSEPVLTEAVLETVSKDEVVKQLMEEAQAITSAKIGERLMPRIERDFQTVILPKMEETISDVLDDFSAEELEYIAISSAIGKGDGERIFHIKNELTGEDVLCFHVRRDHPPLEGYSFNFHYHTHEDQFESHHMLANVYWGKDTPAKFGSKMVH
ncbi:YpjP family protein [Jeotgalibacillus proteolyticus]|nr:YpjP family protein [Jeotgalibacillus proteolyticus]